jgi:penicillin-binding protein 1A
MADVLPARSRPGRPGAQRRHLVGRVPWRRVLVWSVLVVVAIGMVPPLRRAAANVLSRAILLVTAPIAPSITSFTALPAPTRIEAADGSLLAELDGGQRRQQVRLASLPAHVTRAVLAAEDADFYHHAGVDPAAVARAVVRDLHGSHQGASTITQQLAKLNYTGSHRTILRKLREILYASELEQHYSKNELLERYLNQVYFGDGAYGLAAAADTYFGVTPAHLTPAQAATLAGKIRSPSTLDPATHPRALLARRNQVLHSMAHHHWLSPAGLQAALATPLRVAPPHTTAAQRAPHFIRLVEREAAGIDQLGGTPESRGKQLFTGGYTIRTTLDPKAYDGAQAAATGRLGAPGDPTTAIASVEPGDGAIRLLFGGLDPNRTFDVASDGQRQPGSAFKPFVYLAALEAGIDPRSTLDATSPRTLRYKGQSFTVDNYEGRGGGQMSIDDALVKSVNVVYAQLGLAVGPANVVAAAEKAGIHHGITPVPAVALGGLNHGVSPLEMAAAYATFADGGLYAQPYSIVSIANRHGRVVYRHRPQTHQAFDRREVGVLTATLERVVTEGTGTAASIDRPVAGKTGTTSNYTNAWFVGYVPQLATAVWVGDPDRDVPMTHVHGRSVTGGSFPALLFADTMRTALAGVPVEPLATASPDELSLHGLFPVATSLGTTPPASSTTSASSTSSSSSTSTSQATTSTSGPTTTQPTTTTTAPRRDTTTYQLPTTTTAATAQPPP